VDNTGREQCANYWSWKLNGKYTAYTTNLSRRIEAAYLIYTTNKKENEFHFRTNKCDYFIDFNDFF